MVLLHVDMLTIIFVGIVLNDLTHYAHVAVDAIEPLKTLSINEHDDARTHV